MDPSGFYPFKKDFIRHVEVYYKVDRIALFRQKAIEISCLLSCAGVAVLLRRDQVTNSDK